MTTSRKPIARGLLAAMLFTSLGPVEAFAAKDARSLLNNAQSELKSIGELLYDITFVVIGIICLINLILVIYRGGKKEDMITPLVLWFIGCVISVLMLTLLKSYFF